jgi:hypothetical protein
MAKRLVERLVKIMVVRRRIVSKLRAVGRRGKRSAIENKGRKEKILSI